MKNNKVGSSTVTIRKQFSPLDLDTANGIRYNGDHSSFALPSNKAHRGPNCFTLNHPSFLELFLSLYTSCMELLDTNSREDFPFFASAFSDNPSKQQPELIYDNGFPLESSSYKPLFQNPHHFNHHHHQLPQNGSNLNFHTSLDHFFPEGGSSSSIPIFGVPTPSIDPFEAYTNGFSKDFGAYNSSSSLSSPSMPLASDRQKGIFMHSFHPSTGITDHHQEIPVQTMAKTQIYPPLSFREFGSTSAKLTNELSCITAAAAETRFQKRVGKKKRIHVMRKASKAQKKSNIIKGQWTPQEDR